ncbi:signal peptidase I [Ohessyouella blattaphilus]|uniref:Signal peptidase I n=1 Tax=Ohessyouella blattaphilus TaxID=2949333 RepID=A0ABT1EKI3_9FIRM|nr:signal peptidase I [Ohessyouella blattaphilus]MCP1111200.1 signal peptidase I [Ohessyouella blattaphilus]MCR8564594.1 signal peptidase I [Ohessyouella blattaphilus]
MFEKVCNFISTVIIAILFLAAAALLLPKLLGYESMVVISGSMEPNIPVGSIVLAKETEPSTLEAGDVISYYISKDTVVTHRVVKVDAEKQEIVTKGDNNNAEDANPVMFENVIGKVRLHLPYVGQLSLYIRTPLGIGVGCSVVVVLLLLNFLPSIWKAGEKEEKKPKKEAK